MFAYYWSRRTKNENKTKFFRTAKGTKCDFTAIDVITGKVVDQCQTYTREGIALNVNQCIDETVATINIDYSFTEYSSRVAMLGVTTTVLE